MKHVKENDKSQEVKQFVNTNDEDFEGMYGGRPYVVKKGKALLLPEYLAIHLSKQLSYKTLMKKASAVEQESIERGDKNVKSPSVSQAEIDEYAKGMVKYVAPEPVEVAKKEIKEEAEAKVGEIEKEFEDLKKKTRRKKK